MPRMPGGCPADARRMGVDGAIVQSNGRGRSRRAVSVILIGSATFDTIRPRPPTPEPPLITKINLKEKKTSYTGLQPTRNRNRGNQKSNKKKLGKEKLGKLLPGSLQAGGTDGRSRSQKENEQKKRGALRHRRR